MGGTALVAVGAWLAWRSATFQRAIQLDRVLTAYRDSGEYVDLTIDYPLDQTVFPPEIIPPTFSWSDRPATVYVPTTARAIGHLLKPDRTLRQLQGKMGFAWPMSADEPVGPAVLVNRVGEGTLLTMAASPDFATAGEHPIVEARTLLRGAVRFLHPSPRVRVSAPANVEVVVSDDPQAKKLRIHLIAYNSTPQTTPAKNRPFVLPGLIEDVPIFRVAIEVSADITDIETANSSTVVRKNGRRVEATIEEIHEVIVLSY